MLVASLHRYGEMLHQFAATTPDGVAAAGLHQLLIWIKFPAAQAPKLNTISSQNKTKNHYIWCI